MVVQEFVLIPYSMYQEANKLMNDSKVSSEQLTTTSSNSAFISNDSHNETVTEPKQISPNPEIKPIDVYQETLNELEKNHKINSAPYERSETII